MVGPRLYPWVKEFTAEARVVVRLPKANAVEPIRESCSGFYGSRAPLSTHPRDEDPRCLLGSWHLWWRKQKEQQAGDGLLGAYVLKAGGAQSREQRVMAVWR